MTSKSAHDRFDDDLRLTFDRNAIEILKNKQIIKISMGILHALFLEENGTLWSCGLGDAGQNGHGVGIDIDEEIPQKLNISLIMILKQEILKLDQYTI